MGCSRPPVSALRRWATHMADFPNDVEARIRQLLKLGVVVLGLLGTLLVLAFTLYNQTDNLKNSLLTQIGEVKKDTADLEGALKTINERLGRIETDQRDTLAAIVRMEARQVPPTPALVLSRENAELVRTVLAIPPKTTEPGKIRIGDFIAPAILRPVPDGLADRIPSLRGLQYAVDVNYAIALADPAGKVVAII